MHSNNANRYSIDLQTSFQLHLSTAETTFDLLNDKISFFSSKNGQDTFLDVLEEGPSFDDESGFAVDLKVLKEAMSSSTNQKQESPSAKQPAQSKTSFVAELAVIESRKDGKSSLFICTNAEDVTQICRRYGL